MIDKKLPTLAEIKASHAPKVEYERYLLASRFVFRPPSFPAIWLLVRMGVTGETASWLSGLSAMLGFACLLWPTGALLWPGALLLMLFNFMDCLDGGIARIMNARNPYGRFLDSIMWWADMLFWTVVGVTVWRMPELRLAGDSLGIDPLLWPAAGVLCAFFSAYAAYLENTFDQVLRPHWETLQKRVGPRPALTPYEGKKGTEIFARALVHNLRVRETHYLLLAAGFAFGRADLLLAFFLLFDAALVFALLLTYCRRGAKIRDSGLGRERA